jgi:glucose-1-phosphate thymidylyltransferase
VAVVEGSRIVRLVEKPKVPPSDLGIVGIYFFDRHIFDAARNIKPSWRNELEITDAIQYLIDHKLDVRARVITDRWIDTGKKDDLLDVNRVILADLERRIEGTISGTCEITGNVVVEEGAEIVDSTVRGPAIIGKNSRVVRSYVGPFTSIYHHVVIEDSEIENSIVLENTHIIDAGGRIDASLIGREVRVQRSGKRPQAYTLMLGDHSQVELT